MAACREPEPASAPTDAGLPDAGAPAREAASAEPEPEPAPMSAPATEEERLERLAEQLEALLGGQLPTGVDARSLFQVDLDDETSVARRRDELRARLNEAPPDAGVILDAGPAGDAGPLGDAGVVDGAVADGGVPAAPAEPDAGVPVVVPPGELVDLGPPPDGGTVDAGVPDLGVDLGVDLGTAEAELDALERRVDRLRLHFLELPEDQRRGTLISLDASYALSVRADAARAAQAAAAAEQERAATEQEQAHAEARDARSATEREIAEGRIALAEMRSDIARVLGAAARERAEEAEEERERLSQVHEARTAHQGGLEADAAEAEYDRLVALLVRGRRALAQALAQDPDELPALPTLSPSVANELAGPLGEARRAREDAEKTIAELDAERVRSLAQALHEGNELRLDLLRDLPASRRAALRGLGSEGRAQLVRELQQLQLMTRATGTEVVTKIPTWPATIFHLSLEPETRGTVFFFLVVLSIGLFVHRRRRPLLAQLELNLRERIAEHSRRRLILEWWRRLVAVAGPLVFIGTALAAFSFLRDLFPGPEVEVTRTLVLAFATYRLFVNLLHHELTAHAYRLSAERSERIRKSVRRVGRFALSAAVLLEAATRVVGRGTLYAQLVRVLWVVGLALALYLVRRWQEAIEKAYLERHPEGAFAKLVGQGTGARRYLAALGASFRVLADVTLETVQSIVSRFRAGRVVLALLSQRKLDTAEKDDDEDHRLPEEVVTACQLRSVGPDEALPHYPGLETLLTDTEDGEGAAVALVGEVGAGKTSWMRAFAAKRPDTRLLDIPPSMHEPGRLCRWLSKELDLAETSEPAELAERIAEAKIPAIFLDHGQNLYLRTIGGTEAFRALKDVVALTQESTVWLCAFSQNAWLYLRSAAGGQSAFGRVVELKGWNEERIRSLVEHRMRRAGATVSFESLLETEAEGGARRRALERAKDEYFRLLWHYTDGNLRLALYFWLRSLQPTSRGLEVRLFTAPDAESLESFHDETRFALAALILHGNLDAQELATVLRWPEGRCHSLLALLQTRGILEEKGHRYHVTVQWFRAVVRHLKRRRLLLR
mgnify:CR=1 FL=1